MMKYVFSYYGQPQFKTPEAGNKHMQNWISWTKSLGKAIVDRGFAVKPGKTIKNGSISNPESQFSGYSVVQAENLEAAIELTQGCPHLDFNGCSIHVAEVINMTM